MTLAEFDKIRPFLPDDTEVTVEVGQKTHGVPLERQEWGNHDGRYNAHCPACGWTSEDIPARSPMPRFCPKCGNGA